MAKNETKTDAPTTKTNGLPSAAQVAKSIGGEIVVPVMDEDGAAKLDDNGRQVVGPRRLAAADVLKIARRGAKVVAVLADGRKVEVAP